MNINYQFIQRLKKFGKPYFSTADLEKLLDKKRPSLRIFIYRLIKAGFLIRLRPAVYIIPENWSQLDKIANQLYFPSYLSFSSALSRYGIISQVPYCLTFATIKKSKKITLKDTEIIYSQLKPELYFAYKNKGGLNIADPEKALLDQMYLASYGKAFIDYEELTLSDLDKKLFYQYAKRFPPRIKKGIKEISKRWGQVFVGVK